jgi:hypothetical protein
MDKIPDEDLIQYFYDKLVNKESNPGTILTQLYGIVYGFDFSPRLIPFFAKMVKLYGRNTVYMSLLELFDIDNLDHTHIERLIAYIIKRKFHDQQLVSETVDLSSELDKFNKEVKAAGKQKLEEVKDPFDD